MPGVRSAALLACLLACCALPPRVEDRSTPKSAYETFRGAIARAEYAREWDCLSDEMRRALGLQHRGNWEDARAVVLDQSHILIKGICRSHVDGQSTTLPDGRVQLCLDFPFGYEGRVVMRRAVVLRAFAEGDKEPRVYQILPDLEIEWDERGLFIPVPGELLDPAMLTWLRKQGPFRRVEAAAEWFLDSFQAGDETPRTVREDLDRKDKSP